MMCYNMLLAGWYRDIVHRYAPKPRRPYEYPINRFYAHKIDPILTLLADRAGISPNVATFLSLLAGITAACSIWTGYLVAAAFFIQIHHLIDGVDGNLARYHQRCTEFGKRFDIFTDQVVRLGIFLSLAIVAEVPLWFSCAMLITVYFDIAVITIFVAPYARRHTLVRSRWKQWFMDRGLVPGFDIFTIYFIVSICLVFGATKTAVISVAILKTLDWGYRVWECIVTERHRTKMALKSYWFLNVQ